MMLHNNANQDMRDSISEMEMREISKKWSAEQEINLVSQYLDFEKGIKLQNEWINQNMQKGHTEEEALTQNRLQSLKSEEMDSEPIICKQSSIFHNFQKHLLTTLKIKIKLKKIINIDSSPLKLSYDLWQHFLASSKTTKKFLFSILGRSSTDYPLGQKRNSIFDHQLLQEFKYKKHEEIEEAQLYLRNLIVRQSKKLLTGNLLKGRRIQKAEEFKKYFGEFIEQLERGELSRRIPKDRTRQFQV